MCFPKLAEQFFHNLCESNPICPCNNDKPLDTFHNSCKLFKAGELLRLFATWNACLFGCPDSAARRWGRRRWSIALFVL